MRVAPLSALFFLSFAFQLAAELPEKMQAVVIHQYGGPEVLKVEEVSRPEPKDDEVLIRVIAGSVNPVDVAIRSGKYADEFHTKLPLIPGIDCCGTVEKIGRKVTKVKQYQAVYAFFTLQKEGAFGQFAIAKENEISLKPKGVNFEEAAAVPAAGSTAWQALDDAAKLEAGQTVLIHGGSGGVGHLAIQIAKARGARVIATASTANQDFMKSLGADETIDYTKTKFEDVAKNVDVVLDTVGGETLTRSYAVVKKGGIIVTIAGEPDKAAADSHGIRAVSISASPKSDTLENLTRLIEAGKLKPVLSQILRLEDVVQAQEQIATRHTRGKIVLQLVQHPRRM